MSDSINESVTTVADAVPAPAAESAPIEKKPQEPTPAVKKPQEPTPEKELPTVSASPHIRSHDTSTSIMLDVIIAMIPAALTSAMLFGYKALIVIGISVFSCMVFEYISRRVMKRPNTLGDLSAIVTGMLLAFNLPSTIPLWMVPIGAFFAIVVAKQFFGGIGQNFVNPALIGRIVLMVSFPSAMSSWVTASGWHSADAVSTATPLVTLSAVFKGTAEITSLPSYTELMFGKTGGCLGETCAVALLIGFIYLLARRVISPAIPFVYMGTVAVIMIIAGKGDATFMFSQLLSGGLILGAVFMATDYTTSPITLKGKIIYAIGCGVITGMIRLFGNLPEGVSFSIIIMNILTPLIDNATRKKPFGYVKEKKEKKGKEAAAQ